MLALLVDKGQHEEHFRNGFCMILYDFVTERAIGSALHVMSALKAAEMTLPHAALPKVLKEAAKPLRFQVSLVCFQGLL